MMIGMGPREWSLGGLRAQGHKYNKKIDLPVQSVIVIIIIIIIFFFSWSMLLVSISTFDFIFAFYF